MPLRDVEGFPWQPSLPAFLFSNLSGLLPFLNVMFQHSWKLTVLIHDVIPSLLWAFYPFFSQCTSLPYPLIIPIYPFSFISAINEFIQNGSIYIKLKIGKTNLCFRARSVATSWGRWVATGRGQECAFWDAVCFLIWMLLPQIYSNFWKCIKLHSSDLCSFFMLKLTWELHSHDTSSRKPLWISSLRVQTSFPVATLSGSTRFLVFSPLISLLYCHIRLPT